MLDRIFGEDDRPVTDTEIVEGMADLIAIMKEKDRQLRQVLKGAMGDRGEAIRKKIETNESCLQPLVKFLDSKTIASPERPHSSN